jgi:hypothetical protein
MMKRNYNTNVNYNYCHHETANENKKLGACFAVEVSP